MAAKKKNKAAKAAITFVCEAERAGKVFLVGDFNGWDPQATRMMKRKNTFRKRMELAPGEHQYKFVVDGEWKADPAAPVRVPDGHGGENSVAYVGV